MPDFTLEDGLDLPGGAVVVGVDEAGRGPLAGPVTAAAVFLDRSRCTPAICAQIDDSKRMTKPRRQAASGIVRDVATFALGWAERSEIDRLNILEATMLAMQRAVQDLVKVLGRSPEHVIVDGNRAPRLPFSTTAVVKGDGRSLSIAAASILAKTARDERMAVLAERYPGYGWDRNAGYGTAEHLAALARLGPTPEHRRSFAPVRAMAAQREKLPESS